MNVEQILTAIGQTPLPNLLVVGGLVFLFLAIVGKVGAKIVVSEQRQKAAAVIGAVLLLLGLGLQFAGQLVPTKSGSADTAASAEKVPQTRPPSTDVRVSVPRDSQTPGTEPQLSIATQEPPASDATGLLAEAREAWLIGRYDAALNLFDEIRGSETDPAARKLAASRFEWLAPYRGRILFADDFQVDSLSSGTRWTAFPGAPPTGRGGATRVSADDNSVLQLEDHFHAAPRIEEAGSSDAFEVRMRYRAQATPSVGAHINLMMDEREGRTTVGLYATSGELSVWEGKDGREIGMKNARARYSGWQELRIAVQEQSVRVYSNDDLIIDYKSPRARPISLVGFNLETLSGTMWFDDVLVTTR